MKNNRRNFLKFSCLAGLSLPGGNILKGFATEHQEDAVIIQFLNPEQRPSFAPRSQIRDLRHSVLHYDIATYCGHPRMVGFHYFGGGEITVGHFHAPSYYKVYTDVRHVAYPITSSMPPSAFDGWGQNLAEGRGTDYFRPPPFCREQSRVYEKHEWEA